MAIRIIERIKGTKVKDRRAWVLALCVMSTFSYFSSKTWEGHIFTFFIPGLIFLFLIVVGFGPIFKGRTGKKLRTRLAAETKEVLIRLCGGNPRYIDTEGIILDDGVATGSGIALAQDGKIYACDRGRIGEISWADVRRWRWNIEGYSKIEAIGMAGTAATLDMNRINATSYWKALWSSGFFIEVADIDHPEWQFMTADERITKRWMEIFNQINEGKLSVA